MSDLQPPGWSSPPPPPPPPPAWNPYQATYSAPPPGAQLRLASRASRAAAQLLNAAAAAILIMILAIPGVVVAESGDNSLGGVVALLGGLFGVFLWVVVNVRQLGLTGQSLSKKWMGIKIVHLDGRQPSVLRLIFLRYLLTRFLGLIPLFELVDACLIFAEDQRCIHDHLAETIVVQA